MPPILDTIDPGHPPAEDHLGDALAPLLTEAGWTSHHSGRTYRRGGLRLTPGFRELHLDEVAGDGNPVEVLHAVVTSVDHAVRYLRAAGALPMVWGEHPGPEVTAVRQTSGLRTLYVHERGGWCEQGCQVPQRPRWWWELFAWASPLVDATAEMDGESRG